MTLKALALRMGCVVLAVVPLGWCAGARPKEVAVQSAKAANLVFSRPEVHSSQCPHASSARSGRVAVPPRTYSTLEALASLGEGPFAGLPARFLDLSPRGNQLIVERPGAQSGFDVRRQSGELILARKIVSAGSHALAEDDRFYVDGKGYKWSRETDTDYEPTLNPGGEALATAVLNGKIRAVVASPGGALQHLPPEPDYTRAEMNRLSGGNAAMRVGWYFMAHEPGVAAIDASGQTVIALPSGRLTVLLPEGTDQNEAVAALDVSIEANATDLSIVPPFVMVLYGGGDAGVLARRRSEAFPSGSRLDALRGDGSLAWSVRVPFLARQPPIDGNGRVYLVGLGVAAIDLEGKMLWLNPSPVPVRASAFADGTLALARGSELQIMAPDGSVRQTLRAGEELTSFPAIGPDASVWVASAKTLYVAR